MKNKKYIICKGEVRYPNFCPQGIYLQEIGGNTKYHVDSYLGRQLKDRIGESVEENIDFEVIHRIVPEGSARRQAMICNFGEIIGGELDKNNDWLVTVEDFDGNQKNYHSNEIVAIQHAQLLESSDKIENKKWRDIEKDFKKRFNLDARNITNWFRKRLQDQDDV